MLAPATFSERFLNANRAMLAERRVRVAALPPLYFQGLLGILELLKGLDLRPLLPTITAPTLVIGAEDDRTFAVARSHAIAAGIPGARLEVLPAASHGVFLEEPARVLPLLQAFLGR
jgi:3-oxoadipate enol-lactonase